MGLNYGAIHLEVKNNLPTQSNVAEFIAQYWIGLGAKISKKNSLEFTPVSVKETGVLGFAIFNTSVGSKGTSWIAIYDSERYYSDKGLAQALAKKFKTMTWAWMITEAAMDGVAVKFDGSSEPSEQIVGFTQVLHHTDTFSNNQIYFDQLLESTKNPLSNTPQDYIVVSLEEIPFRANSEYSGPFKVNL